MRLRGWMGLGALVMGVVACGGETVGPPAVQGGDLEFTAPMSPSAMRAVRTVVGDREITEAEIAQANAMRETRFAPDDGVPPALLFSKYLAGEYNQNELWVNYGMFSMGTGYTLGVTADVQDSQGRRIGQYVGNGRTEDQGLYWYQRPDVSEFFLLPAYCGAVSAVSARFEVRSDGFVNGVKVTNRQIQFESKQVAQAKCPEAPLTGGGTVSTVGSTTGFKICYYEVWTDLDGNVITWNLIGCSTLDTGVLAI